MQNKFRFSKTKSCCNKTKKESNKTKNYFEKTKKKISENKEKKECSKIFQGAFFVFTISITHLYLRKLHYFL